MNKILQQLCRIGIMPVVSVGDAGKAVGLVSALAAGGIPVAEIISRTQAGEEATCLIAENCLQVLVGADTIPSVGQCQRTLSTGAKFIVSPGYDEDFVPYCLGLDTPVIPGCTGASDLGRAATADLEMVKFFPAEQAGSLPTLKALASVFPHLSLMPTSGINIENFSGYLGYDRVYPYGGPWMTKSELIEGEQWDKTTTLCWQAVRTMLNFILQHVDLPCGSAGAAASTARAIRRLFGPEHRQGNTSDFIVLFVECCETKLLDTHGHIATETLDVEWTEFHLGLQDTGFSGRTRKVDDKGRTKATYLNQTFAGFAAHLMRKQKDFGKGLSI